MMLACMWRIATLSLLVLGNTVTAKQAFKWSTGKLLWRRNLNRPDLVPLDWVEQPGVHARLSVDGGVLGLPLLRTSTLSSSSFYPKRPIGQAMVNGASLLALNMSDSGATLWAHLCSCSVGYHALA